MNLPNTFNQRSPITEPEMNPVVLLGKPQTDLSTFDRSEYKEGASWKLFSWYLLNHFFLHTAFPWPSGLKVKILRLFGAQIGKNVVIKHNVRIKNAWKLKIGDNSWLGEGTWIENLDEVVLGKNVCISQDAMLLTGNHDYTRSDFRFRLGKIELEDGVWIGAHAVVCPGVTCKSHSILTVNSVATKDLEGWFVYSGHPAIAVRRRKMYS